MNKLDLVPANHTCSVVGNTDIKQTSDIMSDSEGETKCSGTMTDDSKLI